MRTKLWISFSALLLAIPVAAERVPLQEQTPAETAQTESAQKRCEALIEKAGAAEDAWRQEYKKTAAAAKRAGEAVKAFSWNDSPLKDFIPQFQAAADEYAGTDGAIPFLLWIATDAAYLDQAAAKDAVERLCEDHSQSEALEPFKGALGSIQYYVGQERATELLTLIVTESPLPGLRGWATFALMGGSLGDLELDSEAYLAAKKRLLDAAQEAKDEELSTQVQTKIRIREVFAIGMQAPDISGIDLDGVAFKLSDYEGKVLFVDFWGDW